MCGIVLAGGNMYGTDVDLFEKLLYHDIERGKDSTGVMVYRGKATEVCKFAVPSDIFLRFPGLRASETDNTIVVPGWKAFREKQVKYSAASTVTSTQWGSVYVGHNRAATAGKVCHENAHPFQHGHITLVHNGTLRNQKLLPDHDKFPVDSDNIAYAISTIGVDETIQKLNGAFTLVWIDSSDETLHIIRNSERPFHLLEKTCGDWFGASEEDMLMWVLTRQKSFSKTTIKRHFECKVGTEYIFNISGKQMKLKEEREHVLPTFQTTYTSSSYYSSRWDDYYETRTQTSQTSNASSSQTGSQASAPKIDYTRNGINKFLSDEGMRFRVDNRLPFWFTDFRPYSSRGAYGVVRGYGYDGMKYYQVTAHNVQGDIAEQLHDRDDITVYGTVRSASMVKGILTIAVNALTFSEDADSSVDVQSKEPEQKSLPLAITSQNGSHNGTETAEMFDGKLISYAEWAEKAQKQGYKCPICDGYLMWADIGDTKLNHAGKLVHFDCERYETLQDDSDNNLDDNDGGIAVLPVQYRTARMVDGSTITFEQFQTQMKVQGGCCPYCNDPIDWDEIECCKYYTDGRTIMHEGCEDLEKYDDTIAERLKELDSLATEHNPDEPVVGKPVDETFCDVCKEWVDTSDIDEEATRAIGVEVCKYCSKLHNLPSAKEQVKGVWIYTASGKKNLVQFTEQQFKQWFIKAMGSDDVTFADIDFPDVRIEQLGTKQFRYYRRPKGSTKVVPLTKQLSNGKTVNKAIWMKINVCFQCHAVIPWNDAEKAQFAGNTGRLYCEKCYSKVGVK